MWHDLQSPRQQHRRLYLGPTKPLTNVPLLFCFTATLQSINPFNIPKDREDDFKQDYLKILQDMKIVSKYNTDDASVNFKYRLIVVHAHKPASEF